MKALILAGGFAKRMGELGMKTPKALLPVAGRPVIEHILDKIGELDDVTEVFVSTNSKFESSFREWLDSFEFGKKIELVVEPAMEQGQKLGSIGAINFFIDKKKIGEDLLIVNGDNVFDFDLKELMDFYRKKKHFVFGVHESKNIEEVRNMGVVTFDRSGKVTYFEEKPQTPRSMTISTGIYVFPADVLALIKKYITEGNNPDRMGDFLVWLMGNNKLFAIRLKGRWFDIGTPETYKMANEEFSV